MQNLMQKATVQAYAEGISVVEIHGEDTAHEVSAVPRPTDDAAQPAGVLRRVMAWQAALIAQDNLADWSARLRALLEPQFETCVLCLTAHWSEAEQSPEMGQLQTIFARRAGVWQTPSNADAWQASTCWRCVPLGYEARYVGYLAVAQNAESVSAAELAAYGQTLSATLESVRRLQALRTMNQSLEQLSIIDPLTGLYNRNGFVSESERSYREAIAAQKPILLMFADLDGLKIINDSFGHTQGDVALREAGAILQRICVQDEICCRFGGDEFLIFSTNATPAAGDALMAAFDAQAKAFSAEADIPFTLSMSMGYHIAVPQAGTSVFQLLTVADHNMYAQKKRRKQSKYLRKETSQTYDTNEVKP